MSTSDWLNCVAGLPSISVVRIPEQSVAIPRTLRQHSVQCGQAHIHGWLWTIRILERCSGLQCQNRTEATGSRFGRKQHQILLRRIEQHIPRLLWAPDTDRAGVLLHRVGCARWSRAELLRSRGPERSHRRLCHIPVPVFFREYKRHRSTGWPNTRSDILWSVDLLTRWTLSGNRSVYES